jgi:acyl-CoA synthetase (AMP-forming)/AMP-acid ligase II
LDALSPLAQLLARRASRGDDPYLLAVRSTRCVSYRDVAGAGARWAERLDAAGVAPGGRVALSIGDPLDLAEALLGVVAAGRWVAPFDPALEVGSREAAEERARRLGASHLASDLAGETALRDLDPSSALVGGPGGIVLASSGTTGTPKVMALSIVQLLATASLVVRHHRLTAADRGFNPLPLYHVNAEVVGLLATLVAGGSLALDERFHRTAFWEEVERLHATWVNAVPAIIARLSTMGEAESIPAGVRFVRSASAPLAPTLLTAFESATGLTVVETYGMTEAASQICANPLEGPRKAGSVGRPVGVALRLRVDGREVAAGQVGEVEISGPTVITAYESPGYEDRFSDDGWLRTGDLGRLDEEGYLFLAGRRDDVINRGGEKILPREVEEVLLGLPEVIGAAVVGRPDAVFGEVPIAYVELDGVDATTPPEVVAPVLKELRERLVGSFSRTRRPEAVHVVSALPAHVNGKVRRAELRDSHLEPLFSEVVG